ncbi:MAG: class I SAM-dependent methyltransferase [Thermoplasmata archaeon]
MKRVNFDRVADEYDATRALPNDVMNKVIYALCEEMSDGESVLDVGSGTGRFALPLIKRGFYVTGIDISKRMIEISKNKGFSCCVRGDASFLPFESGSFDFALANHILHLLEDWKDALSEIGRVVRDSMMAVSIMKESGWFKVGYDELLKKYGCETGKPGIGVTDLLEKIEPKKVRDLASVTITQSSDVLLDRIEKRCYSSLWEIPEETHRRVVEEMREKYEGREIENSFDVVIYIWDVRDLDDVGSH